LIVMTATLANRKFVPRSEEWIHAASFGEHPHPSGIVQVIDPPAVAAMAMRIKADLLKPNHTRLYIDADHNEDGSSKAVGYVLDAEERADGLWIKVGMTELGEDLLNGGIYGGFSSVFDGGSMQNLGGNRRRPTRFIGGAVCNDPNIKGMVPILNRRGAAPLTQRAGRPALIKNRETPRALTTRGAVLTITQVCEALKNHDGTSFQEMWNNSTELLQKFQNREGLADSDALWREALRMEQDAYDRTWDMHTTREANHVAPDRGRNIYKGGLQPARAFVDALHELMNPRAHEFGNPHGRPSGMDFAQAWAHLRETEPLLFIRHVFKMMHPLGTDR